MVFPWIDMKSFGMNNRKTIQNCIVNQDLISVFSNFSLVMIIKATSEYKNLVAM